MAKKLLGNLASSKTRLLIVGTGAALIIGTIIAISNITSDDPLKKNQSSSISIPKGIDVTPGGKTSAKYRELQQKDNRERAQIAKKQGTSSIPTIVGSVADDALNKKTQDDNADFLAALGKNNTAVPDKKNQASRASHGFTNNPHLQALLKQQETFAKEEELRRKRQRSQLEAEQLARLSAVQQKKIADLAAAMDGQTKAIFSAWNDIPAQQFVQGNLSDKEKNASSNSDNTAATGSNDSENGSVLIKAGDILFAVLDTSVNSDEPGPIMATVVQGKFKDSKLLGTIQTNVKSKKIVLNFNRMSIAGIDNSVSVKAVAIDPVTARTALASDVDNHYFRRYGMLFASAFLSGYSKAITESGTKSATTEAGTTTTENPKLSGKEQVLAGFGEVGKKISSASGQDVNIPPTITVDAGIGLGLLFLNDLSI